MLPLLLLAAVGSSAPVTQDPSKRPFLVVGPDASYMHFDAQETEGRLCHRTPEHLNCDHPVWVRFELKHGNLRTSVAIAGAPPFVLSVPVAKLPHLDWPSTRIYDTSDDRAFAVTIVILFGEPNDCYANDDGRERLSMSFVQGKKPRAWITSFADCQAKNVQIAGSSEKK